jgi:hypothetical protein
MRLQLKELTLLHEELVMSALKKNISLHLFISHTSVHAPRVELVLLNVIARELNRCCCYYMTFQRRYL